MTAQSVPDFVENLFTVARLYGWCDQVTDGIRQAAVLDDEETAAVLRDYLIVGLGATGIDKEAALLSLVLLYRRKTPLSELFVPAYAALKGRLHANDFRFLIDEFFDGTVPLPRSLAYDITEKLFFSIDWIFDKLVEDFRRVPFRNAETIVFYLMLENCRIDLNTQNKELVCIILTHIEIRLPDVILEDIVEYLDAHASAGEKWAEQRKTITFARELKPRPETDVPLERQRSEKSGGEAPAHDPPVTGGDAKAAVRAPERPISPAPNGIPGSEDQTPGWQERGVRVRNDPARSETARYEPAVPALQEANKPPVARPEILHRKRRSQEAPSSVPLLAPGKSAPDEEKAEALEPVSFRQNAAAEGTSDTGNDGDNRPKRRLAYSEFMEGLSERGILLSRLDPRRWNRRKDGEEGGESRSPRKMVSIFGRLLTGVKRRLLLAAAIAVILAASIFLIALAAGRSTAGNPAPHRSFAGVPPVAAAPSVSIPTSVSAPHPSLTPGRFVFERSGSTVLWRVRKGDTLYDLYRFLRRPAMTAKLDPRLSELAKLDWRQFLLRVRNLNPPPSGSAAGFDLIYPRDRYALAE